MMTQRVNAKGRIIEVPGHGRVEPVSESAYRCGGCGRMFAASEMRSPYSWALDSVRWHAVNKARAQRHADLCMVVRT